MEANNDLPVKVGGEMISKNQAAARLAKATVEAKALAGHAAELAAAAGQTFQVPPGDGLPFELSMLEGYIFRLTLAVVELACCLHRKPIGWHLTICASFMMCRARGRHERAKVTGRPPHSEEDCFWGNC
jgi:hypothetical protein